MAARLERAVAGEQRRRRARPGRRVGAFLAAAGLAGLAGFGGYLLSARAGLNEPPAAAVAVDSADLRAQAHALAGAVDLDPHRFSRAWWCARDVTDGRITGLASATVDGRPALLVYTRTGGETVVTVVLGGSTGAPSRAPRPGCRPAERPAPAVGGRRRAGFGRNIAGPRPVRMRVGFGRTAPERCDEEES